jgi:hypothetical protein
MRAFASSIIHGPLILVDSQQGVFCKQLFDYFAADDGLLGSADALHMFRRTAGIHHSASTIGWPVTALEL